MAVTVWVKIVTAAFVKGRLLGCKRPCFSAQKATFQHLKHGLLQNSPAGGLSRQAPNRASALQTKTKQKAFFAILLSYFN